MGKRKSRKYQEPSQTHPKTQQANRPALLATNATPIAEQENHQLSSNSANAKSLNAQRNYQIGSDQDYELNASIDVSSKYFIIIDRLSI